MEKLLATVAPKEAATISNNLINEFNSIARIFGENDEALKRVVGDNHRVIELLHAAHSALTESLLSEIRLRQISYTNQLVVDYLVASMGVQSVERLRVLFLDRGNHLIGDEIMASGTLTTLTAYPRVIFKRAFELSATAIMLVHNHPGGNVEPSKCDIDFTKRLVATARPLEIEVQDHIIIAGAQWFSFLRRGLL